MTKVSVVRSGCLSYRSPNKFVAFKVKTLSAELIFIFDQTLTKNDKQITLLMGHHSGLPRTPQLNEYLLSGGGGGNEFFLMAYATYGDVVRCCLLMQGK